MATDTHIEDHDDSKDGRIAALRDLLSSPGWQLLREQAAKDWGPAGYGAQMQAALASVPQGPDRAYEIARLAEQLDNTCQAVNRIIAWPTEELHRLEPVKESTRPFNKLRRAWS